MYPTNSTEREIRNIRQVKNVSFNVKKLFDFDETRSTRPIDAKLGKKLCN